LSEQDRIPQLLTPPPTPAPIRRSVKNEEEEDMDELLQQMRGVVGEQEECFRLRSLNNGVWTEGCPVQDTRNGGRTHSGGSFGRGRQPRRLERSQANPGLTGYPDYQGCNCDVTLQPLLLRLAEAETGLEEMRSALSQAVLGLQESMTGLSHRFSVLESRQQRGR